MDGISYSIMEISYNKIAWDWSLSAATHRSDEMLTCNTKLKWSFLKMGVPQNGWFIMENPYVGVPIINHYVGVYYKDNLGDPSL